MIQSEEEIMTSVNKDDDRQTDDEAFITPRNETESDEESSAFVPIPKANEVVENVIQIMACIETYFTSYIVSIKRRDTITMFRQTKLSDFFQTFLQNKSKFYLCSVLHFYFCTVA